jgi:hypothetical protein
MGCRIKDTIRIRRIRLFSSEVRFGSKIRFDNSEHLLGGLADECDLAVLLRM